jgi:hypothetical protein
MGYRRSITWLVLAAMACGSQNGPTAIVLDIYFSEMRETRAFIISGVAQLDGVAVNVFPTSQRPESTPASFGAPQSVRILLNDSIAGIPIELSVIGINAEGEPVEAATQTVSAVARREVAIRVTLSPLTQVDGGVGDAGFRFDAGGIPCSCATGCCDGRGQCAPTRLLVPSPGGELAVLPTGAAGTFCSVCPPGKADTVVGGQCRCGTAATCGAGLRCVSGQCKCDGFSGCEGCCSSNGSSCEAGRTALVCGNAGNACGTCSEPCTSRGVCGFNCPAAPGSCCTAATTVSAKWPTCARLGLSCQSCDVLRSSECAPATASEPDPCRCGDGPACPPESFCLVTASGPRCRVP